METLLHLIEAILLVGLGIMSITMIAVGIKIWKLPNYEYDRMRERLLNEGKIDERDIDNVLM